ncbi:MAG: CARDB domain-containing protein [Dehalococcoidia bacterium]
MRPPTIAGLLVLAIAALTIGGVWLFGGDSGEGTTDGASPTATGAVEGPQARVALTSNMYASPSRTADLVAVVPEDRAVRITGRTDDSSWLRVIYPVTSSLEGWIAAPNFVDESLPDLVAVPDVASVTEAGGSGEGGLLDEPALPDLSVSSADVAGSGLLTVRITNLGRSSFSGAVTVRVTTAEGEIVASLDADLSASPLGAGRSAAVNTGFTVAQTGLFIVEVDPSNEVEESSEFNNSRRVLLVGTGGEAPPPAEGGDDAGAETGAQGEDGAGE